MTFTAIAKFASRDGMLGVAEEVYVGAIDWLRLRRGEVLGKRLKRNEHASSVRRANAPLHSKKKWSHFDLKT